MKKLILLLLIAGAAPLQSMAQDDMYFVPSKQSKTTETRTVGSYADSSPTYYRGSDRSVDEYNRQGQFRSYYESVGTDSLGNDIIVLHTGDGVYPDSIYDGLEDYADEGDWNVVDDFEYTRRMEAWDDYYGPWGYGNPYLYSNWWWRDWWWGWYDPWYYGPYYGYYGWYYPWRYYYGWGGWWYPGYYGSVGHHYYHGGNPRGLTGGRTWGYGRSTASNGGFGRSGSTTRGTGNTYTSRSVRNRSFGNRTSSAASSSTRSNNSSFGSTRSTSSYGSFSGGSRSSGGSFGGGHSGGGGRSGGGSFGGGRR